MQDLSFLENKTAIITGAAGGIGSLLCRKLAGYHMNLILVGRNEKALETTAAGLPGDPDRICVMAGDLKSDEFLFSLPERAADRFGSLDVLINNAGLAQHCSVEEVVPALFDDIMATNVRAPYFLCQQAIPYLRKSEAGTIINICSVVAHKGYPMQSVYAASKHALLGFSKSLANELYQENIRVHVISPGAVFTEMAALARPDLSPDGMILPEDIAEIVGFFLEHRRSGAVTDEIMVHRVSKEPFA